MAFQVSPGVNVSEIDLSGVIPAVSVSVGAIAGVFRWGPTNERVLVSNEKQLAQIFGEPASYTVTGGEFDTEWSNCETFFSAANFLSYSNALYVTRVASSDATAANGANFIAKYPGELGNSLEVSFCTSSDNGGNAFAAIDVDQTIVIDPFKSFGTISSYVPSDSIVAGNKIVLSNGKKLEISSIAVNVEGTATINFTTQYNGVSQYSDTFSVQWGDASLFLKEPSTNHAHVVVRDRTGLISGTAGTILEVYENLSSAENATTSDGSTNYILNVLENRSNFVTLSDRDAVVNLFFDTISDIEQFSNGTDGSDESTISVGDLAQAYDLYQDSTVVDVSYIIQGKAQNTVLANYIANNIAEARKDCIAFVSPPEDSSSTVDDIITWQETLTGSSYMVVDSGYKYQYDKYNDVYRWVPLNADIAGLCARTDVERDPWFSPAGYNRGIIKNVVKLRLNPTKAERDLLYLNSINPVITEPGSGALLFGDKTYSPVASAFDRINVRRLFIVLEKAIANASKALLFEFNDEFTRAQFKNLVEPFLREVQGRRGIFDFRVVCDETNNTSQVIDSNQFVGDIFIKPARSINFIQLNFVAVRTGVEFEEVVGAV